MQPQFETAAQQEEKELRWQAELVRRYREGLLLSKCDKREARRIIASRTEH